MPTIDYMDCFRTGPDTIAGKYMRKFWHPVFRAEDLKPGWAKPIRIMGEDFTLVSRRKRQTASRRLSLPAPPIDAFRRLGRGRLHPLPFSRLEIRQLRAVCRATGGERSLYREGSDPQLSHGRISRTHIRLLRRRRCSSPAPLSGFRERGLVGGDLRSSLQFS